MSERLKSVCKMYYGKNLPEKEFSGGKYPVYGANGIIGYHDQYTHESQMLLVSCRGENSGVINLSPPKAFITNNSIICELLTDTIEKPYLYYSLKSQRREKLTSGSAQPQITTFDLGRFKLPSIPENKEQKAIAGIISKVDEAIEAVENSIKAAERLKKSLMQNLLTGKLKPDGTWRSEDEFYVDDKFGKVPKGWKVKKLKEISDFHQYGLNITSSEDAKIAMFRMNNIIEGKMVDAPMVYVNVADSDLKKYKVEKGDILFNRTNSMDLVGKIGIFELEGDFVFASYLIRVRINKDNNPYFFNFYLNSYKGQTSLRAKATPAVSQANINAKSLVNTYVPVPPPDIQLNIVEIIQEQEQVKVTHRTKLSALKTLKKSLMKNLLTGKVRVDVEKINKLLEEA